MNRLPLFAALTLFVPAIPAPAASAQAVPVAALSDSAARALITERVEAGMGVGSWPDCWTPEVRAS